MNCARCKGKGVIYKEPKFLGGTPKAVKCPSCGGSGRASDTVKKGR